MTTQDQKEAWLELRASIVAEINAVAAQTRVSDVVKQRQLHHIAMCAQADARMLPLGTLLNEEATAISGSPYARTAWLGLDGRAMGTYAGYDRFGVALTLGRVHIRQVCPIVAESHPRVGSLAITMHHVAGGLPKPDSVVLVWTVDGHWAKAWFHNGAFVNEWGGDLPAFGENFALEFWSYVTVENNA